MDIAAARKQVEHWNSIVAVLEQAQAASTVLQQQEQKVKAAEARLAEVNQEIATRQAGLTTLQEQLTAQRLRLQQQLDQTRQDAVEARTREEARCLAVRADVEKYSRQLDRIRQDISVAERERDKLKAAVADALARAEALT